MAEQLHISDTTDRAGRYRTLLPQLQALLAGETDPVANMANCCAALRQTFGFFWVGFYMVKGTGDEGQGTGELVLGPFQGDVACTRIAFGKGVCGTAWQRGQTIVVPDVDAFPGHIACSSSSRSEIVVPLLRDGAVIALLDVDSDLLDDFTQADRQGLEAVANIIAPLL
ncbi:MAG: GAF domain-containing protein [Flavobacteriales bacterium]|nr:GAF domain-containing protein [Flavobacteriales bacterium]